MPERIALGCPQQKRRHERMHCTLSIVTQGNLSAQQRAFYRFVRYNEERPHQTPRREICPVLVRQPSPRPYPDTLEGIVYPDDLLVRKARQGWISTFVLYHPSADR